MKCAFCDNWINERRVTTFYAFVPRKNGTRRQVRWCKPCDENKAEQIDRFLKESNDLPAGSENG